MMDPSTEKEGRQHNYVSGFGSLASFMASDADHSTFVYRRFDRLATRDLSYYQSQLSQLQAKQDEFDIADREIIDREITNRETTDREIVDSTGDDREDHCNRIRDCAQDWDAFQRTALGLQTALPTEKPSDDTQIHLDGPWKERMDLAMKIRATLKKYREALIQESTLLSMSAPSTQTMNAMSQYFHGSSQSSAVTRPAAFSMLSGASSSLYPVNMSESQIRSSDYISLSKPTEPDQLTKLLQTRLSRLFRVTRPPVLPLHREGRPQPTISHLKPSQVKYYSYERIRFAASFITTLAAAILLFVPIYSLYNTSRSQPSVTLALIAMFTVIFAGALALMTTASRSEIFGACAAYCAVLVVFVSGDFASGGGNGG